MLSEKPGNRTVGLVGAEASGADGVAKVPPEDGELPFDVGDAPPDPLGDRFPGSLGRVGGLARPSAEPAGGGQLTGEEVCLPPRTRCGSRPQRARRARRTGRRVS
jgi:hypothetical protein